MKLLLFLYILPILFISGCARNIPSVSLEPETEISEVDDEIDAEELAARELASSIAAAFNDRQLSAQVLITGIEGRGQLSPGMRILLNEFPVGGVMLFRYNLDTDNNAIRNLIDETAALISAGTSFFLEPEILEPETETSVLSIVLPFVAVDHEGGFVNRFLPGVASLPSAVSYWEMAQERGWESAIARIYTDSLRTGNIINSLGINMNFAPVAEHQHLHNRDFLANRAYGPDPVFTANASAAFIMGMTQAGILCTVKHFPGSAGPDPHFHPSALNYNREILSELAAPFAALIRDGHARAVMIAHTAVPAWDSVNISSLSPEVMGGWLRQELGFEGIIICDDFLMAASEINNARPEAAAVQALAAGADMIMVWPPYLRRTHREILAALGDGRLSRERLQDAAERNIFEKIRIGLIQN